MDQEIEKLEQEIKKWQPSGGFTTPGFYEAGLADRIRQRTLMDSPKDFQVPEGYFYGLNQRISNSIPPVEAKVIPLYKRTYFVQITGIAAMLLLTLSVFWNSLTPKQVETSEWPETEDVASYLNTYDLNADALCDAGWCNELEDLDTKGTEIIEEEILLDTESEILIEAL